MPADIIIYIGPKKGSASSSTVLRVSMLVCTDYVIPCGGDIQIPIHHLQAPKASISGAELK